MKRILFPFVITIIALAATPSHAGYQENQTPTCVKNADGSGYCYGTWYGFRNSPNAGDEAAAGSSGWFYASLNNVGYSCWGAVAGSNVTQVWPQLVTSHGYFQVNWDKTGTCSFAYVINSSRDPSSW